MGFFSTAIGFVKTAASWVAKSAPAVVAVAKKVAKWTETVGTVTKALLDGKDIVFHKSDSLGKRRTRKEAHPSAFDTTESVDTSALEIEIRESKQSLASLKESNTSEHSRIKLQIGILELIIASQTIDRFANNIKLHASSLNIHFHSLRNQIGMLNFVNRQNKGLKATIAQLNHVIYHLKEKGIIGENDAKLIRDIDLEMKPGAVSISKQYDAFEETRKLLEQECDMFVESISTNISQANEVRILAKDVPDKAASIIKWLEKSILPKLEDARVSTRDLQQVIARIPLLELSPMRENEEDSSSGSSKSDESGSDEV